MPADKKNLHAAKLRLFSFNKKIGEKNFTRVVFVLLIKSDIQK